MESGSGVVCYTMGQIYVIKELDTVNSKVTLLDSTLKFIEANICEMAEETIAISTEGTATVLGFITNPNLISEFSYGEGKPYVWNSEKKELLRQCEDTLATKPFKKYSVGDRIMLSNWKLQEKSDRCGEYYEEYEYDGYTPEELEDMYRGAFEGAPEAEWNID